VITENQQETEEASGSACSSVLSSPNASDNSESEMDNLPPIQTVVSQISEVSRTLHYQKRGFNFVIST
jgi:hypothetical protein